MIHINSLAIHKVVLIILIFLSISSCKKTLEIVVNQDAVIEQKVDNLLLKMTLDEKIGQISQVRHFADITDEDIASKFIGSVIHTSGPNPREDAAG